MIDITSEEIKKSLRFYDIDDKGCYDRCIKCLDYIRGNNLNHKLGGIMESLYNNDLSSMWSIKNVNEIFVCDDLWVTNIILLMGYKIHSLNIKKYGFDEEQTKIHKYRVRGCLTNDIYNRNLDGIRFSQLLWGLYFIRIKLIKVGRLQYELSKGDIKLHIFGGTKLNYDDVLSSLRKSKFYIHKYFKIDKYEYYCNSWILSKEILKLVGGDSNIAKFQSLFEITEGEECLKDVLNHVYGISSIDDFNNLTELTSLQKEVKRELLNGTKFYLGCGKLKKMPVD